MDIRAIPLDELNEDKAACLSDIEVCKLALLHGVKKYGNGRSTKDRLLANKQMVEIIDAEIERRKRII